MKLLRELYGLLVQVKNSMSVIEDLRKTLERMDKSINKIEWQDQLYNDFTISVANGFDGANITLQDSDGKDTRIGVDTRDGSLLNVSTACKVVHTFKDKANIVVHTKIENLTDTEKAVYDQMGYIVIQK